MSLLEMGIEKKEEYLWGIENEFVFESKKF